MEYETNTNEECMNIIREHERLNKVKFAMFSCTKNFGFSSIPLGKNGKPAVLKVHWKNKVPSVKIGTKRLKCEFGPDKNLPSKKAKLGAGEEFNEHNFAKPQPIEKPPPQRIRVSKKINCPVAVNVSEMLELPELRFGDSRSAQQAANQKARELALEGRGVRKFRFTIPKVEEHRGHFIAGCTGPTPTEKLQAEIKTVINKLSLEGGNTTVDDIARAVTTHVVGNYPGIFAPKPEEETTTIDGQPVPKKRKKAKFRRIDLVEVVERKPVQNIRLAVEGYPQAVEICQPMSIEEVHNACNAVAGLSNDTVQYKIPAEIQYTATPIPQ